MHTVFSFLNPLRAFIIWLQRYTPSDWLFSCNDQALLARCPRRIQSVFYLIVDILMDIHVMVNWQLSKRYPLTSVTWLYPLKRYPYGHPRYGQLTAVKVSADRCHLTVSFNKLYADQLLDLIARTLRSITSSVRSSQGNLRPRPWCIDLAIAQSTHQGLGLRIPCNDLTLG